MLDYTFLAIRDAEPAGARLDKGLLHPVPGSVPGAVRGERRDGDLVSVFDVEGIALRYTNGKRDLLRSCDLHAKLFVTDSRVVLASGSHAEATWQRGTPPRLRAAGAVSTTCPTLVGQVRHPWLHGVYTRPEHGQTNAMLRLFLEVQGRMLRVDVWLPNIEDPDRLALDIARRAARFRLSHDRSIGEGERDELRQIAAMRSVFRPRSAKQMPGIGFPTYHPVSSRSALCLVA